MENFLLQFFIFVTAATIAVPIAKKIGFGSVLGYLMAGILIGPHCLSLIQKTEEVMHFTEFGVVMMLFLVGLELKPSRLWQMRKPIIGMGGTQVVLTACALTACGCIFLPWKQALAIGLALALSSTAIVLQTLNEKGLMKTPVGRSIFSVLLCQDLAIIPMLAFLPLLASFDIATAEHTSRLVDLSHYGKWAQLGFTLGAILLIFIAGKYAARPIFRGIAATRVREVFVAAALSLVVGISLLMIAVGLSPALGTFLAGVVLANSEYRHELESAIQPFKALLLGIFFITTGATINFTLISHNFLTITGIIVGLIVIKWLALWITGSIWNVPRQDKILFAIALAQGGEFAFVLLQAAKIQGVLQQDVVDPLISAVAISMFLAPILFIAYEKLTPTAQETDTKEPDTINKSGHKVILAGFGRLGTDLGRLLIAAGIKPVIIDNDPSNVEALRKFGFEVYYGDISRLDLLESAGAEEAELLIVTIDDTNKALELVEMAQQHYPQMEIIVNAHDRKALYGFMGKGIALESIRRQTFGTAMYLGRDALIALGYHPYEAHKIMRLFQHTDQSNIPQLYATHCKDQEQYISLYQKHNTEMVEVLQADRSINMKELETAWKKMKP